jgi:protein TonB
VQGIIAAAILTGFAGGIARIVPDEVFRAWPMPRPSDPPKPEPTITPTAAPSAHPRDPLPTPEVPMPRAPFPGPDVLIDLGPVPSTGGGGDIGSEFPPLQPSPSASPSFTPRAARPLANPGRWVSDADYPTSALRRGEQGVTGFELTIGPDGRVRNCTVTRSSGSADLDAATCAKVTQRARFDPASDDHGAVVAGRYSNTIRWQIPE